MVVFTQFVFMYMLVSFKIQKRVCTWLVLLCCGVNLFTSRANKPKIIRKRWEKKPKHELNDTKMFCRALILPWLKYFPCILLLFTWQKNTVGLMKFDCHNLVHIAKFVLNAWVPETLPWNAYREVWCLTFLSASVLLNLLHNLISPKFFVCMQMCGVRKRCW